MRMQIFILLVVVSVGVGSARAALIWDEGHHVYSEGEETSILLYNDASAEIIGGFVHWITVNDQATVIVKDGTVTNLQTNNTSAAIIEGGNLYGEIWSHDESSVDIIGGDINWVTSFSNSSVTITGGYLVGVLVQNSSHVEIRGSSINERLVAFESSVIDIFGYEFSYDPAGGQWDGGQLTGFWEDGTSFNIDMQNWDRENGVTFDHINLHVIPEPSTLILLALMGCSIMRIRCKSTTN